MEPQSVVKMQKTGQKHFLVSQKRWLSSGQEILTKLKYKEVTYELHMWLRKIIMEANKKSCSTCSHYDGKFGDDKCFNCLCTIKAVEYERRTT